MLEIVEFCVIIKKMKGGIRMSASEAAKYIIIYAATQNNPISNLKLQKILYYVQGYHLRLTKVPAFNDDCEAWQYGPVFPSVYFQYSMNRAAAIQPEPKWNISCCQLSLRQKEIVESVACACLGILTSTLVEKTHGEDPWCSAIQNNSPISTESIYAYFKTNDPLNLLSEGRLRQ